MVKLVFCLTRLPHLSREEFQRHWRERHGPLVRESAKALGIRRYVQVHTLATPVNDALRRGRGGPEAYDGAFIDLARSPVLVAEEHPIVG